MCPLDMNILIALIDPAHLWHDAAHAWFAPVGSPSWATCPITGNGVIRIVSHPKYPNAPGMPAAVVRIVARPRALPGHVFWKDTLSLVDSDLIEADRLTTSGRITDTHLLALAVSNGGQLATFDRRLAAKAVRGGKDGLHVIAGGG